MNPEIHAYAGNILRVNLTNGRIAREPTERYAERFLGGRGINQWILYNEVRQETWPFDPANVLIFGTGILVGTLAPGACRYTVDSRNVVTGGVGSANSGGHFSPELKFAGYDHVLIQGRNRKPCYLWIDDDNVEIRDASHLWGKTTWETEDAIRDEHGDEDIQVASMGPAGENLVRDACIINNGARAAGRCGLGAIMGSKNLKAVAVRGNGEISVAEPDKFMSLVEELWGKVAESEEMSLYRQYGTTYIPERNNEVSANPVRNFQDGYLDPEKVKNICAEKLEREFTARRLSCFACPIACSHYLKVQSGEFKNLEGEGFEANTLKDFGYKLEMDNLPAIINAHILCSQYGLDVDNTSGSIAWAMECYERGILKEGDTDGLKLEWGNHEAVMSLIHKIAWRQGFGDLLAEGSLRAARAIGRGSEKYSMNLKGQDLYEVLHTAVGWAIGAIVSPIGGGHLRGSPGFEFHAGVTPEEGERFYGTRSAGDRKAYDGKANLVIFMENFKAVVDCMGICYHMTWWRSPHLIGPNDFANLFMAATGRPMSADKLMEIGERIHNIEKAFNTRAGMTRKDDRPPERFFEEPIKSGPGKGERLDRDKFEKVLDEYYGLRGWDVRSGLPTDAKLREIGLNEVADDLRKIIK